MSKVYIYIKYATLVNAAFWSWYCSFPVKEVVTSRPERNAAQVFLLQVSNLAVYTFDSGLYEKLSWYCDAKGCIVHT